MQVTQCGAANVWRLLVASFVALPVAVMASVDGDLGEAAIGYGDMEGDVTGYPQAPSPILPGATLPGATKTAGGTSTSTCDKEGDTCCTDPSISFLPFCSATLGCDQSTQQCTTCDVENAPCCFNPVSLTETCQDPLTYACTQNDDFTSTCIKCDKSGRQCCKDSVSGEAFCDNFLACNEGKNKCAGAKNYPVACDTEVTSSGLAYKTEVVWEMGKAADAKSSRGSYDVFYDVDPGVDIVFTLLYSVVEGEAAPLFDPTNIDYVPSDTKTFKQPVWPKSSFKVIAQITVTDKSQKWAVHTSCVE